jgi:hypothetical protein
MPFVASRTVGVVDRSGNVLCCRSAIELKTEWFSINQCEDGMRNVSHQVRWENGEIDVL